MQLLSQLIFVKKKIKNINDNGLKTAILRVSKKWEGGGKRERLLRQIARED